MVFSRQEYWSELPFPSPGDLPNPGIESGSPTFQEDFFFFFRLVKCSSEKGGRVERGVPSVTVNNQLR